MLQLQKKKQVLKNFLCKRVGGGIILLLCPSLAGRPLQQVNKRHCLSSSSAVGNSRVMFLLSICVEVGHQKNGLGLKKASVCCCHRTGRDYKIKL